MQADLSRVILIWMRGEAMGRGAAVQAFVQSYNPTESVLEVGGQRILSLRTYVKSQRWDRFWHHYLNLRQAA